MKHLPVYPHRPRLAVETAEARDVDHDCRLCKLHEGVRTVCLSAEGEPGGLLLVGESPGKTEDALGRPFIGKSGELLRQLVRENWRGPVAIDNAIRCAPGRREITDKAVDNCRGFLAQTVAEVRPTRIIALGSWAAYSLTGRGIAPMSNRRSYTYLYAGIMDDAAARRFADRPVPVFCVLHPAAALRNRFVRRWFEADMRWALTAPAPEPAPLEADLRLVETAADAEEAVRELRAAPWSVPDVEAAGVMHTPSYRMLCLSLCPEGSDSPLAWNAEALRRPETRDPLLAYLRDPAAKKRGQNIQYDLVAIEVALGVRTRGVEGDTRLWRKLLEPEAEGKLDKMMELVGMGGAKEEAGEEMAVYVERVKRGLRAEALLAKRAEQPTKKWPKLRAEAEEGLAYLRGLEAADPALVRVIRDDPSEWQRWAYALIPDDMLLRYNARDTISTAKLSSLIEGQLAVEPDIDRVRRAVVDPASVAIARVERWGVCASTTAIQAFDAYLLIKLDEVRRRLDQYGKDFNPGSPKQVGELLFGKLGLQPIKFTDSGAPSTDDSVLELLAAQHPVAADIAEHRRLSKLQGNYASGMLPHVRADGRIHTTILLDGARSGRTSSSNPNLQNIPRPTDERGNTEGKMARDCFVSPPGHTLVELDYSQLELRIAAMMSGDPEMLAIFEAGVDYHLRTAQLVSHEAWGIPPEAVVDAHRSAAKTINFAVLYGMGDAALAAKIGCSKAAARRVHDAIMGRFHVLDSWIASRLAEARKTGVAWTWWDGHRARRRPLWRIADEDDGARINAENSAHNTPVQGTASEFCIASLIRVVQWIEDDGLEDVVKLVLPIHDALLLEVRNDYVAETKGVVREIMEGHNSGAVRLKADCKLGPAWGSLGKEK